MPEINYKTIEIKASFGGAHFRDYDFFVDKAPVVKENEKIGTKLKNGSTVQVIDPPTFSEDKQWIQVMNESGLTGFIRASHIDLEKLKSCPTQKLDKPFSYFISEEHRIVYEAKHGIRKYSKDEVKRAEKGCAELREVFESKNMDAYAGNKRLMNIAHFGAFLGLMEKSGISIDYNPVTGRVTTSLDPSDLHSHSKLEGVEMDEFIPEKEQWSAHDNGCIKDIEDSHNFKVANRAYAEMNARERVEYRRTQEAKQKNQLSFDIPESLVQEKEEKVYDNLLKDMSERRPSIEEKKAELKREKEKVTEVERVYVQSLNTIEINEERRKNPKKYPSAEALYNKAVAQRDDLKLKLDEAKATYEKNSAPILAEIEERKGKLAEPTQKLFKKQVDEYGGFLLGEAHGDQKTRNWITDNIANMKAAGIKTIYIEHLSKTDQEMIENFMKSDEKEIPRTLKNFDKHRNYEGMPALIEEAKKQGMNIVGLRTPRSQAETKHDPYTRALIFNQSAIDIIQKEQERLAKNAKDENEKHGYIVLAGHGHLCMHEGREKSRPIQGFSQLLKMHSFEIDENMDFSLLDPGLIQCPVKKANSNEYEQTDNRKSIQDYRKENKLWNAAKPSRMNIDALEAENRRAEGPKIGAHRAIAQARKAEREKANLGFEEITKEDIEAAKSRHSKPIIGGHRARK